MDEVKIESVSQYLGEIADKRSRLLEDNSSDYLFFRGQSNKDWEIYPSVFRNNMLHLEAKMIHQSYARQPQAFRNSMNPFEKLAVLQHYGLCTRLLDVTLNPLVALYFSCLDSNPPKINEEDIPSGVVYCGKDYGYGYDDSKVLILSAVAETDFDETFTIGQLLEVLEQKGILNQKDSEYYRDHDKGWSQFVDILQNNYFVIPSFNNERLVRQSGAFLLPGCITLTSDDRILKTKDDLINKFQYTKFNIPGEKKEELLNELDLYNINEGSLFPELEHQMNYIKKTHEKLTYKEVQPFSKYEPTKNSAPVDENTTDIDTEYYNPCDVLDDAQLKDKIKEILDNNSSADVPVEEIFGIFNKNKVVDWYKKEQVVSKIKKEITRYLHESLDYSPEKSEKLANSILKNILSCV